MTSSFLEAIWFVGWLFAAAVISWWSWRSIANHENRPFETPVHWRNLYQEALLERDEAQLSSRVRDAEAAILLELANQVFTRDGAERRALQEAMKNLKKLRETYEEVSDKSPAS